MNDKKMQEAFALNLILISPLLQKFIQNLVTQFSYTLENVQ
jgi:hypothetical protein